VGGGITDSGVHVFENLQSGQGQKGKHWKRPTMQQETTENVQRKSGRSGQKTGKSNRLKESITYQAALER